MVKNRKMDNNIHLKTQPRKNVNSRSGRIRPFVLALVILLAGLLLDQEWWKVGALLMLILFGQAYYHYRT